MMLSQATCSGQAQGHPQLRLQLLVHLLGSPGATSQQKKAVGPHNTSQQAASSEDSTVLD